MSLACAAPAIRDMSHEPSGIPGILIGMRINCQSVARKADLAERNAFLKIIDKVSMGTLQIPRTLVGTVQRSWSWPFTQGGMRMREMKTAPRTTAMVAALAGLLLATAGFAADAAKPASSCVACHTDVTKLQEEAKGIPIPTGSALQAGKG